MKNTMPGSALGLVCYPKAEPGVVFLLLDLHHVMHRLVPNLDLHPTNCVLLLHGVADSFVIFLYLQHRYTNKIYIINVI